MKENAAKTNYKSYRSKLKKLIQQAELNYFRNKFDNSSGNIRKAWSVINSIRCKSKNNILPNFIDTNGVIVTNRREICSKFNEYFVNVARNLNSDKYNNLDVHDYKSIYANQLIIRYFSHRLLIMKYMILLLVLIVTNLMTYPLNFLRHFVTRFALFFHISSTHACYQRLSLMNLKLQE